MTGEKYNNVFSKEYWDNAAKTDPYGAILCGKTKEEFETIEGSVIQYVDFSGKAVLDLGCGIGRIGRFVAPRAREYVGVDWSEEMIKLARERSKAYPNTRFIVNNGRDIPCGNGYFDVVCCDLFFQHVPKGVAVNYIGEIHRVLKDGGICVAHVPLSGMYVNGFTFIELEEITRGRFKLRDFRPDPYYIWAEMVKQGEGTP